MTVKSSPKHIVVAYHSGFGHTKKVATAVAAGAGGVDGVTSSLLAVDTITDEGWEQLNRADGIIFGSPTYMGGVSAPFKTFMDSTSKLWYERKWKDKIAAGFTNSGSLSGDKQVSLQNIFTFAMQHGMIWVGQAEMGPQAKGSSVPTADDINRIGSYSGLMTQSNNEPVEIVPPKGDIETAKLFGIRIAEISKRFI